MNNYMNNNTKGFTLLEVMISILVIGIIASIVIVNNMDASKGKADMAKLKSQWVINEGKYVEKLVGKWSFDEGSGTAANDSSTFGRGGVVNGGAVWKGESDCLSSGCLEFDGTNDYVNIGSSALYSFSGGIVSTVSMWVKQTAPTSQKGFFGAHNPVGHRMYFGNFNNKWDMGIASNAWGAGYSGALADVTTDWTYIVVTMSGNQAKMYVNSKATITKNYTAINLTGNIPIGALNESGAMRFNWNGKIDEVSIYNSVMTLSEIRGNYVAGLNKMLAKGLITEEDYEERLAVLNDGLVAED